MFEYLMPQLVMPSYEGSLLDQTARATVARQIEYGRQRDVPWGISESGYNTVDARMNYQYRAFGVPGLGLQRGLAQDLVIAPYASMMALMVAPEAACQNLQRLAADGFSGRYGMYEAIDYTPARLPRGQTRALVRSFMAHHQGMGLLALDYLLHDEPMQRRFVADPEFQATLLLLQERIPRTGAFHPNTGEVAGAGASTDAAETRLRIFRNASSPRPAVQMLSNGRYHVMLTSAGSGYSRLHDMAVTRWREDGTRDHWGNFCYLRDVDSGEFWSTAYQPTAVEVDGYEAIFSDAKAEFRGRKHGFETHTEIAVSPEDDIELRRLRDHQPCRAARAPSRSPPTPRWCWRRRSPTSCTRPSATCSCRPSWCRTGRRSSARGARARRTKRRRGCSTCWPCTTPTSTRSPTRPIARASSAAATTPAGRRR